MLNNVKPNEVTADALKYKQLIAGRPKSGKTSLFHGVVKIKYDGDMSKGLLVAFEKGYQALNGIHAVDIKEWEDFQELVEELVDNKDEVSYESIALDTIDILIKRATTYMLNKESIADKKRYSAVNDIPWGKGYELLERTVADEVDKLEQAGYNLFFITHDKDKTMTTREGLEYNKTVISASGRGGDYFRNSADMITFIELTKEVEKGKKVDKRYIYFRGDADMEAGSRFEHLPVRVEYDPQKFVDAIEDAIRAEYGGDEKKVDKAKKEQAKEELKEAKEEEKAEKEAENSVDELMSDLDAKISKLTKAKKTKLAKELKAEFETANYKKMDSVEDLEKVVGIVDNLG